MSDCDDCNKRSGSGKGNHRTGDRSPVNLGAHASHKLATGLEIDLPDEVRAVSGRSQIVLYRPNATVRSAERDYLIEHYAWLFEPASAKAAAAVEVDATPKAIELAAQLGVDLNDIEFDGRIGVRHVREAATA